MFTRQHYNLLAEVIKETDASDDFVHMLCIKLKQDNAMFDIDRFLKASGKV